MGQCHSEHEYVAQAGIERLNHVTDEQGCTVHFAVVAVVRGQWKVVFGNYRTIDVRDGYPKVSFGDVQSGDESLTPCEGDLDGAAAAAGGGCGVDDAGAGQLFDDIGDRCGRQPRRAGEFHLGQVSMAFEGFDDSSAIGFA
ncbi:hypothetical protein GCM10007382_08340 [Salinibacterium xinjiangense]|nr:hypothetical protein GCM10007382_08340 [Salinibacterium xinjiangense]